MGLLADLKMYGRFAWGLPSFFRHTISLEEARAMVQRRLAERETNFLRLVERGIFGYAKSPYLPLLKLADCAFEDIRQMVRTHGLEDTLRTLREAGVYVTFEEFKGRAPMVRQRQVIPVQAQDFDNPYLRHYYQGESGESSGAGTRVDMDLDHLAAQVPHQMLTWDAHNILGAQTADSARAIWHQARTLRVKRMEPVWTARGKLMPLHLAQRATRTRETEA